MKLRRHLLRVLFVLVGLGIPRAVFAQLPYWWIYAPPGVHTGGGPGDGTGGKLVVSPIETAQAGSLSALIATLSNVTSSVSDFTGSDGVNTQQQKVIKEAIGSQATGEDLGEIQPSIDPVSLVRRQQLLEELKARPDAEKYAHFIAYFTAMQSHEARQLVFIQRANLLIKTNRRSLNWQERIRLAAEVGLLNSQETLANQEAIEVRNRAVIQASLDRLADAYRQAAEVQKNDSTKSMLGAKAK